MGDLSKLVGKNIGVYLRKEDEIEDFLVGVNRLSWLTYELQDKEVSINLYIDEFLEIHKIDKVIEAIKSSTLDAILIWSSDDIDFYNLSKLVEVAFDKEVPIISFCEGEIDENEFRDIKFQYIKKKKVVN